MPELLANIPFPYVANNTAFSSGRCKVTSLVNGAVKLTDANNQSTIVPLMVGVDVVDKEHSRLVFRHYGDHYFLARIETPEAAYQVFPNKAEAKMARQSSTGDIIAVPIQAAAALSKR
jgi:hypothetical protein